jgi:hypothetical protein
MKKQCARFVSTHLLLWPLIFLSAVLQYGCGPSGISVREVFLSTPHCVIEAEDGSFTIETGKPMPPPFDIETFAESETDDWNGSTLVEKFKEALDLGARRVRVKAQGLEQPYYGVLVLSKIRKDAFGPASRSFNIEIPEEYFRQATGGRVSVVYETVEYGKKGSESESWYAWILWLSDRPL